MFLSVVPQHTSLSPRPLLSVDLKPLSLVVIHILIKTLRLPSLKTLRPPGHHQVMTTPSSWGRSGMSLVRCMALPTCNRCSLYSRNASCTILAA
eukprot:3011078-Rhodomonas_salina.2